MDGQQLSRRELLSAEVSSKTVNAARDMAELKSYRRKAVWPQPDLSVGEPSSPTRNVLGSLLEGV